MKKLTISLIFLSSLIAMNSCGDKKNATSSDNIPPSTTSETTTEPIITETEPTSSAPKDYIHGEDGYFNLLDNLTEIEMKSQQGGTCWLYSGANSMETNYALKNGSYITIDPLELLEYTYGKGREEGFLPDEGINAKEVGGWQWIITETLSRGFGNLTEDSAIILDASDREKIKETIRTRGSVSIGVNDTDNKYKGLHGKYYTLNYDKKEYDHDVTIVGYDDHFPKDYFNIPASEDGAWITYNSSLGSAGYYYISYSAPLEYAISHSITDKYTEVLAYDAGNEDDKFVKTGDFTTTANVFHKPGTLAAVGTYNDFDDQEIKIEVYDTSFTNLLYSQDAQLEYHGYQTIDLDTPIEVTDYAIAITYSKGAPVEGETIDYGYIDYITKSENGQSFIKLDTWRDLTESGIESKLGIDCKPGNCCIKALYQ